MADDELILSIDKALWPKGVMRGLTTVLRTLGDKHGNLVIVAQPTKGTIMLKGSAEQIEGVKPELREVIEEHFPDADVPEELLDGSQPMDVGTPAAPSAPEPAPPPAAPAAPAAAPSVPSKAPPATPAAKPPAPAAAPAGPVRQVRGRRERTAHVAPPDLLWECVKGSSSFIRKPVGARAIFSAEPTNLTGLHSFKFSGLIDREALDVHPLKRGPKEAIELIQSPASVNKRFCPKSQTFAAGLSKCPRRALAKLDEELQAKFYRADLCSIAKEKYLKVHQSYKKKRPAVKPPRSKRK